MNTELMFSSKTDMWSTPQDFFIKMNDKYGFAIDVCATLENRKCFIYIDEEQDTLKTDWIEQTKEYTQGAAPTCWMNPPYGREIGKFIKKAYEESLRGCTVVCLLPARTDTKWFHDYCIKGEIEFIKGRLKFGDCKNAAPFPSMIVVFKPKNEEV